MVSGRQKKSVVKLLRSWVISWIIVGPCFPQPPSTVAVAPGVLRHSVLFLPVLPLSVLFLQTASAVLSLWAVSLNFLP